MSQSVKVTANPFLPRWTLEPATSVMPACIFWPSQLPGIHFSSSNRHKILLPLRNMIGSTVKRKTLLHIWCTVLPSSCWKFWSLSCPCLNATYCLQKASTMVGITLAMITDQRDCYSQIPGADCIAIIVQEVDPCSHGLLHYFACPEPLSQFDTSLCQLFPHVPSFQHGCKRMATHVSRRKFLSWEFLLSL